MELTKKQRNFFADLDLDKALAAGDGKVNFNFHHNGHVVEVAVFCSYNADIIVKRMDKAGRASYPDRDLCLMNIPDTMNVSATAVLRRVHEAAGTPSIELLKQAWLDTPYVERWHVSVREASTEFTTDTGDAQYMIAVAESPDDDSDTGAELFVCGVPIHTFTIPQPYHNDQTSLSLLDLAESITEAWRYAVLADIKEEESK